MEIQICLNLRIERNQKLMLIFMSVEKVSEHSIIKEENHFLYQRRPSSSQHKVTYKYL